jgi:hypothetical protein
MTTPSRCPYCHTVVDRPIPCPACGSGHHIDCWQENAGCCVHGCSAAPIETSAPPAPNPVSSAHLPHATTYPPTPQVPAPPVAARSVWVPAPAAAPTPSPLPRIISTDPETRP